MNAKTVAAILISLVCAIVSLSTVQGSNSVVEDFYKSFDTDDSLAWKTVYYEFNSKVPNEQKATILAELLQKSMLDSRNAQSLNFVPLTVLWLLNVSPPEWQPFLADPKLEKLLYQQADNEYLPTRKMLLKFLIKHRSQERSSLILRFLADPEEDCREAVLKYVGSSEFNGSVDEAKAAIKDYVVQHRQDPNYATSVKLAERYLQ